MVDTDKTSHILILFNLQQPIGVSHHLESYLQSQQRSERLARESMRSVASYAKSPFDPFYASRLQKSYGLADMPGRMVENPSRDPYTSMRASYHNDLLRAPSNCQNLALSQHLHWLWPSLLSVSDKSNQNCGIETA